MQSDQKWQTGVVIGGGFSGLIAADILSNYFNQVIIYDRDDVTQTNKVSRSGIPPGQSYSYSIDCSSEIIAKAVSRVFRSSTRRGIAIV